MVKLKVHGEYIEVSPTNLNSIISSISYDSEAQQAVIFYEPIQGYEVILTIVPVLKIEEYPTQVSLETLRISPQEVFKYIYGTKKESIS